MSEETWRKIASKLRYCHGTSSVFVPSILKQGLLPRTTNGERPSVYKGELESKKKDSVYLSKWESDMPGFCGIAADNAAKAAGGEIRILDVKLEPDDLKRFSKDEDSWNDDFRPLFKDACGFSKKTGMTAGCYDTDVKKVVDGAVKEGLITQEESCAPPKWFAEISCLGKFAVIGGVSKEKIIAVRKRVEEKNRYKYIETSEHKNMNVRHHS